MCLISFVFQISVLWFFGADHCEHVHPFHHCKVSTHKADKRHITSSLHHCTYLCGTDRLCTCAAHVHKAFLLHVLAAAGINV